MKKDSNEKVKAEITLKRTIILIFSVKMESANQVKMKSHIKAPKNALITELHLLDN